MNKKAPEELRRVRYRGLITPSQANPWRGARDEGDQFTGRQHREMTYLGIDPQTVQVIEVRSTATIREWYAAPGEPLPVYVLECPVLGPVRADGRVLVLSPGGHQKLVYTDGSITRRTRGRATA